MQSHSPVIHFAHANGFPSGTYQKLFTEIERSYPVFAIEKMGHSSRFPVNDNWRELAHEVLDYIAQHVAPDTPVVAVGHSFGAVVSYLAACIEPQRFCGLIMLDPPLASGFSRHLFALAKRVGVIDRITPAQLAITRRRRWQRSVDLVDYFANKGLFRHMDRDCIADYVAAVIEQSEHEQVLTFDPNVEAQVFRTIPHNLNRFSGKLQCPGVIVTGEQTDVCVPFLRNAFIRQNNLKHLTVPGGHMFPLERPLEIAQLITTLTEELVSHGERVSA
ncbi:alpha/beta fold hydrolase [Alteromonas flava]|uniref:alpha/beta fold hydrolase n=1 Tax=Alteromonas flava TaxID=2048003 RepID=UPI000C2893E0|nr:alpha/beta hydrolase [Alteromonas flava]